MQRLLAQPAELPEELAQQAKALQAGLAAATPEGSTPEVVSTQEEGTPADAEDDDLDMEVECKPATAEQLDALSTEEARTTLKAQADTIAKMRAKLLAKAEGSKDGVSKTGLKPKKHK